MSNFKLGGMIFGSLFKKPETLMYPFVTKPAPVGLKGHIENNVDECILCGVCQKVCPAGALEVEKKEHTWSIDYFRCVQCRSCVYACPRSCLDMSPVAPKVSVEHTRTTLDVPETTSKKGDSESSE